MGAVLPGFVSDSPGNDESDYLPTGGADAFVWRLTPDASAGLLSIVAGVDGAMHLIFNISTSNTLEFEDEDTGETAANRILCPDNTIFFLGPQAALFIWYDTTSNRWRIVVP